MSERDGNVLNQDATLNPLQEKLECIHFYREKMLQKDNVSI